MKMCAGWQHVFYYISLPKLFPSQFSHVLRKDMFSFYLFLEKPRFLSLGEGSGGEMGRRNMLGLCSKLKNIQQILSTQRCGHL